MSDMDHEPATSVTPSKPVADQQTLTVVVPAYQAATYLEKCLTGLQRGGFDPKRIIVVDDGSTDDTSAVASRFGVVVVRHERGQGASAARNTGAAMVESEIICFVDADVIVHEGTATMMVGAFENDPDLDALFGSYDAAPTAKRLVSRYRNLLHHYVHHQSAGEIASFWTGFGAVKASVFHELGGFDSTTENVEDVDFGMRMKRAGRKAVLDPTILSTHLKDWRLLNMLKVDLLGRAVPWAKLMLLRHGMASDLNTSPLHQLNVVLVGCMGLSLVAALHSPWMFWASLTFLALFVAVNFRFFGYLWKQGGIRLALISIPLHVAHYACAGAGFAYVFLVHFLPANILGLFRRTSAS